MNHVTGFIITLLACAADGITTRKFAVKHGRVVEGNAWLYGSYPSWTRLAAVYTGEMLLWTGLEWLMKGSGHPWAIMIPRFIMAGAHGWAAWHNTKYY